jgi:hypothetical protein
VAGFSWLPPSKDTTVRKGEPRKTGMASVRWSCSLLAPEMPIPDPHAFPTSTARLLSVLTTGSTDNRTTVLAAANTPRQALGGLQTVWPSASRRLLPCNGRFLWFQKLGADSRVHSRIPHVRHTIPVPSRDAKLGSA